MTHHPAPPQKFQKGSDTWYGRSRHFPLKLPSTFPGFGRPSVIVIGEAQIPRVKSTSWLFTATREPYHQMQNAQPDYFSWVEKLAPSDGDRSGTWMLNYPFPYERPEAAQDFQEVRDLLLACDDEPLR